jgi:D-alanine transaminase
MSQIAFLNGQFLPIEDAMISTQDRGFLFGDGVYEVIPVFNHKLFEFEAHFQRLQNSLKSVSIANPLSKEEWKGILQQLIEKHPWKNQFLYLQITRGVQMVRNHMPDECLTPTLYAYTNPLHSLDENTVEKGIKVITLEDIRWLRCDIKAITLLPNVMMKLAAKNQAADDAILISQEGKVLEGTASNVFIIKNNTLYTPPISNNILPGITRQVVERIAKNHAIKLIEKELTIAELEAADEIWLTSSTKNALPVCELNGKPVGAGITGKMWKKVNGLFAETILELAGDSSND